MNDGLTPNSEPVLTGHVPFAGRQPEPKASVGEEICS